MFTTSSYPKDDGCHIENHFTDTAADDQLTADILDGQVLPELLPDVHPTEIRLFFADSIGVNYETRCLSSLANLRRHCGEKYDVDLQVIDLFSYDEEPYKKEQDSTSKRCQCINIAIVHTRDVSITHEFLQLFVRTADEELLNFNADNVPKCIGLQTFSRLLNALRNAGRDVAALQKFYQLDTNNCLQRGGAMVAEQVQLKVHDDDDVTTKAEVIPLLREGVNILCCNGMHHNCEHQCLNQRSICRQLRTLSSMFGSCDYFVLVNGDWTESGTSQTSPISVWRPVEGLMASLDFSCSAEAVHVVGSGGSSPLFQPVSDIDDVSVMENVSLFETIRALIDRQITQRIDDRHSQARLVCNPMTCCDKRSDDELIIEAIRHWRNAERSCRQLLVNDLEQDEALAAVADYVRSETSRPLIVTGNPGDGKTSVMSRAAFQVRRWIAQRNGSPNVLSTVVLRLLTVADSAASVIAGLASHLLRRGDPEVRPWSDVRIGSSYSEQRSYVSRLLTSGDFNCVVVIMLDGIEEMKSALELVDWLPVRLPSNVKVILSCTTDGAVHRRLEQNSAKQHHCVHLHPPTVDHCCSVVDSLLRNRGRTLTADQWTLVAQTFGHLPSTMFARLIFEEVRRWRSFDDVESLRPALNCRTFAHRVSDAFERIEREHGKTTVTRALGYLSIIEDDVGDGLTDNEMVDLLSIDGDVMSSIVAVGDEIHKAVSERRFPSSVWTRLRIDLAEGLATETNTTKDRRKSMRWTNRSIAECAVSRYAKTASTRVSLYSHLADYYSGSQRVGVFGSRAFRSERYVPDMPLCFWSSGRPNIRKLRRLPVCLQRCNRLAELFDTVLFNPDWLLTKLKAFAVRGLLEDFAVLHPANGDADCVADAIRKSERSLSDDPCRILIELKGRLSIMGQKSDKVRSLINKINAAAEAAASSGQLSLLPVHQTYGAPQSPIENVIDLQPSNVQSRTIRCRKATDFTVITRSACDKTSGVDDGSVFLIENRATNERHLRVWDVTRFGGERRPDIGVATSSTGCSLCLSTPDGRLLALFVDNRLLQIYHVASGDKYFDVEFNFAAETCEGGKTHQSACRTFDDIRGIRRPMASLPLSSSLSSSSTSFVGPTAINDRFLVFALGVKTPGLFVVDLSSGRIVSHLPYCPRTIAIDQNYFAYDVISTSITSSSSSTSSKLLLDVLPPVEGRRLTASTSTDVALIRLREHIDLRNGTSKTSIRRVVVYVLLIDSSVDCFVFDVDRRLVVRTRTLFRRVGIVDFRLPAAASSAFGRLLVRTERSLYVVHCPKDDGETTEKHLTFDKDDDDDDLPRAVRWRSHALDAWFADSGGQRVVAVFSRFLVVWDADTARMICALPSTDGRPIVAAFPLELQNKALTLSVADDDFRVHTWNFNNVDYVKLKGVDGVRRYVDGGICFLDAARTNGSRFVCAAAGSDEAIVARIADGEVDRVIRAPKCSDDEKTENFAYLRFISVSGNGTFAIICWQQQQLQAFGDKRIGDCQQSTTTLWNLEIGCSFGVVENCLFAAFVPGDQHAVFITVNEDERKNSFSIVKYDLDKERSKTGYSSFGQFPAGKFIGAVAVAFSADKSILIAFLMENNHFPNNATLLICSQDYCKTIDLEELMMEESVLGKRTCEVRPYDMKLLGGTTALIAVETSSETCSFVVIDLSSASIISVINSLPFGRNVMSILTSCDSQTGVVVSFGANKLFQCSLRNGAEVANLKCCRSSVSCIITEQTASFLSNSNLLIAIESTRRHVAFISTDDGSVRFRLAVHGYALVLCLTGNDAKRTIVIGCDDGRVLLFAL